MDKATPKTRDNIQVVVRIRPANEEEQRDKYHTVTQAVSDCMLVFDPNLQRSLGVLQAKRKDVTRRRYKDLKYAFDFVFGPAAKNQDIFQQSMKGIVQGVVEGYNCSVFAYGATGAGKTHTMLGNDTEPGVIYHTMIDLYQKINQHKHERDFDVSVSYSEVYNEQVRDLLIPRGNLPIREDKIVGVITTGLSHHKPKNAEELLHMLQFGNQNRTQHHTDANAESSRSHAVFQVFVSQNHKAARVNTEVKMAKMCLVDLAGSERAHATTNHGIRFREGANINRSLLALGNVINALADSKYKGHIPYRESKLTRLLKDSLGGNCRTVMIAAVSPSSKSYDDTYNTLRYADRAKHIRANLKQNVVSVNLHIANYKKYVEELEKQTEDMRKTNMILKKRLEQRTGQSTDIPGVNNFEKKLVKLFKTRKEIRKSQMASDGVVRELKWKVSRKEKTINRVQNLTQSLHVVGKHSRVIDRMKQRIEKEEYVFESALQRLKHQEGLIQATFVDAVTSLRSNDCSVEPLEQILRLHTVEASLQDTAACLAFVKKMAQAQERQSAVNEKLIMALLDLVKRQYDVINSEAPNLLLGEMKERYEECCYLVEERGVMRRQGVDPHVVCSQGDVCITGIIDIQVPRLHLPTCHVVKHKNNPIDTTPVIHADDNTCSSISSIELSRKQSMSINVKPKIDHFKTNVKLNVKSTINPTIKAVTKPSVKRIIKPTNAVKPSARTLISRGIRILQETPDTVENVPEITLAQTVVQAGPTASRRIMHEVHQPATECRPRHVTSPPRAGGRRYPARSQSHESADLTNTVERPVNNEATSHCNTPAFTSSSTPNLANYKKTAGSLIRSPPKKTKCKVPRALALDHNSSEDTKSSSDNNTFELKRPSLPNTPSVGSVSDNHQHRALSTRLLANTGRGLNHDGTRKKSDLDTVNGGKKYFIKAQQQLKKIPSAMLQGGNIHQKKNTITPARRLLIPSVFLNTTQKRSSQVTSQTRKDLVVKRGASAVMQLRESWNNRSHSSLPVVQSSTSTQSRQVSDLSKSKNVSHKTRKPSTTLKPPATVTNESNNTNIGLSNDSKPSLKANANTVRVPAPRRFRPSPAPRTRLPAAQISKIHKVHSADSNENKPSDDSPECSNTQPTEHLD